MIKTAIYLAKFLKPMGGKITLAVKVQNAAAAATVTSVVFDSVRPRRRSPPSSPVPGFSRQEHWSGLPFPPLMRESEK